MAKFRIEWLEKKSPDWIVATLKDSDGLPYEDASINRTDKKGRAFPNFDTLQAGHDIEGNPWKNPTSGKWAIYPPDEPKPANVGQSRGFGGVSKLMDKKAENIEKAQERKSESIAYFNSVNSAIALWNTTDKSVPVTDADIRTFIKNWRDWFISEYDNWNKQ